MIEVTATFELLAMDRAMVDREARGLANDLGVVYSNEFRLALVRARAIATAETLQSVRTERTLDSPSRGIYIRRVLAKTSWEWIQRGRGPGKMPPLLAMIAWFRALNIPRKAWFPIRLAIARRGVKPRKVQERMMREAQPLAVKKSAIVARRIAENLLVKGRA